MSSPYNMFRKQRSVKYGMYSCALVCDGKGAMNTLYVTGDLCDSLWGPEWEVSTVYYSNEHKAGVVTLPMTVLGTFSLSSLNMILSSSVT